MRNVFKALSAFLILGFCALPLHALADSPQKLQGSAAVLRLLQQHKTPGEETGKAETILEDMRKFKVARFQLSPPEAAQQWLDLYDRYQALTPEEKEGQDYSLMYQLQLSNMFGCLPPPESWGILADLVKKRNGALGANREEVALIVLTQFLAGNSPAARAALNQVTPFLDSLNAVQRPEASKALGELRRLLAGKEDSPIQKTAEFQKVLDSGLASNPYQKLQIPDLVEALGKEKAVPIIRKALAQNAGSYELPSGDASRALVKKVTEAAAPTLLSLPWNFVDEIHDTTLYEALDARYRVLQKNQLSEEEKKSMGLLDPQGNLENRSVAGMVYTLGLIAQGKPDKALATLQELSESKKGVVQIPNDALQAMDRAGYSEELFDFLEKYLEDKPTSPLWKQYVPLAIRMGKSAALIGQIGRLQQNPNVPALIQMQLRDHLIDAYLADNQVDKALPLIRYLLKQNSTDQKGDSRSALAKLQWNSALRLAAIGFFTGDKGLEDEGFSWLAKNLSLEPQLDYTDYANYDEERDSDTAAKLPSYDELLTRAGRYGEAEDYYLAKIKKITDSDGDTRNTGAEWGGDPFSGLVALYDKVGRVDDVLALANQNPDWGEKDLVGLSAKVQKAVGVALASKGQKAEAEEILKFALLQEPSEDSYYEALLALSPGDVTGWLDQLSQEYPFEKRPLIWKSKILFDQGKLDEAEKTVRAAIKIDPSDGQSGKGDRMRAYADLADILEKKGGAEEAKSCRNIVSAIRMSETADDYLSAGLVKRAIDQYGKSLEVFSDAYCIQSRMAIRLHDLGDYKEAEKHYEKAYELMPDSFGRVESHCFGCERVFEGNLAETTAEKVFQRLCLERPKSPQVHYLLGYLRTLQRRWSEAADSFWQAVQLDPDYLNAWNKLEEVSSHLSFTGAQKSKIGLNQLRLNPACITDSQLISSINPMEAWNALRENEKKQLERPEEFYPLKASADRLEELKKLGQANPNYDIYFRDRLLVNPAMGVVNQSVTKNVIVIMTGKPDYNF